MAPPRGRLADIASYLEITRQPRSTPQLPNAACSARATRELGPRSANGGHAKVAQIASLHPQRYMSAGGVSEVEDCAGFVLF